MSKGANQAAVLVPTLAPCVFPSIQASCALLVSKLASSLGGVIAYICYRSSFYFARALYDVPFWGDLGLDLTLWYWAPPPNQMSPQYFDSQLVT